MSLPAPKSRQRLADHWPLHAISANPLLARKYPGGGTRWLSAAELTRWGADEIVRTLPEVLR